MNWMNYNETKDHSSTKQRAYAAIDESIERGEPVVLGHSDALASYLHESCDGLVDEGSDTRYTGVIEREDDAHAWTVILRRHR